MGTERANSYVDANHLTTPNNGKLHIFGAKAKAKSKKMLRIESSDDEDAEYEAAMDELNESPAFNPDKFLNKKCIGQSGLADRAISVLQGTAHAVASPKTAIKQRATRKTASSLAKSRPYLSRKADLDFLEAHDDLMRVKDSEGDEDKSEKSEKEGHIIDCNVQLENMERTREEMRVAWMTTRHVRRVRAAHLIPPPPFPDESFFEKEDDCGFKEFQWGKWIAYKLLHGTHDFTAQYIDDFEELPFDFDTLRRAVERLVIVSAPLQTTILEVRRIYRWEDPVRTGNWLALYFFLWYISHIMTFFYGYTIYLVAMNYYYPRPLEELRKEIERTIDRSATAIKIGELMDRHGSDDWLGPLLDELGPYIQVQIVDLASFLEVCSNFYHFRSPPATLASLCLFAALFLISALSDAKFALKLFWFILGTTFFACWPVASLYPRYRLLVSPLKILFWQVPNHAEWCFQYLQERAGIAKKAILLSTAHDNTYVRTGEESPESDSDIEIDGETFYSAPEDQNPGIERDILSFGCTYLHTPGRFIISTHGIRFTSSMEHILPYESFRKPFSEVVEMSKRHTRSSVLSPLAKVTTGMDKLEVVFRGADGGTGLHDMGEMGTPEVVLLENMRGRDKVFNAIIGLSGLRWQHLQKQVELKTSTKETLKSHSK